MHRERLFFPDDPWIMRWCGKGFKRMVAAFGNNWKHRKTFSEHFRVCWILQIIFWLFDSVGAFAVFCLLRARAAVFVYSYLGFQSKSREQGTGREDKQEYGGRKKNWEEKFTFGHEARKLLPGALVQVFYLASRVVDTEHVSSVGRILSPANSFAVPT